MDFKRQEFDRQYVGARRQIDRPQEVDELERFKEEISRAIAPLEHRMSTEAEAPVLRRALIERADHDMLATMPSYQYPTSMQHSFNPNFFVFGAMITIVGVALIGVTVAAVNLERVTSDDLSVTRWLTQLTATSPSVAKNDETQAILNDTTAQAEPSPPSSQNPPTEAATVVDHPPSSQTPSSSAEPVQPADSAQPAVATSDHSQDSSSRKDEIATSTTSESTFAATSGNVSSSPFILKVEKNSELYRQYLAWQANREKSQSEQRHSSKRTADAHASIASKRKPRSKQSDGQK
jgi:hypothetical protein